MCSAMPEIFRYDQQSSDDYVLYDSNVVNCLTNTSLHSETLNASGKKKIQIENVTTSHILAELPNLNWSTASPMIPPNVVKLSDKISRFFPADVKVGDVLDVSIGEICDLSKFWMYLSYGELEPLMKNLQRFYSKNRGHYLLPEILIEEGLYCVSFYSGLYHRCVIVNLLPKLKGFVRVFYIDYGTVENISVNQLWFLSNEFAEVPSQAIRARLSNICPTYENRPWSSRAVVAFEKLVTNRVVVAEITGIDEKDHVMEVYLADITDVQNIFYVNDLLVKKGFAYYLDQVCKKSFVDVDCRPQVGHIHLYPEFYEIESGTTPTTEEMKYIVLNKIPLHYYMSQYFDIHYHEQINSIQQRYEAIRMKTISITVPLKENSYEFDFLYFSSCIINEVRSLYEEQNRSKKTKIKHTNISEIVRDGDNVLHTSKGYFCNKRRMTELIHGGVLESSNTNLCNNIQNEVNNDESLNTLSKLNVSADSFVPRNTNPFLNEANSNYTNSNYTNPFLNISTNPFINDIKETVNNEVCEYFSKLIDNKLPQQVNNLTDTHTRMCKTNKQSNLNASNAFSTDTSAISKNLLDSNSFNVREKNNMKSSGEPVNRVRTPPGFSSLNRQNKIPSNVNLTDTYNFSSNNVFNNCYPCQFPYNEINNSFYVHNQFAVPMFGTNINPYYNLNPLGQFNFNVNRIQDALLRSNLYTNRS